MYTSTPEYGHLVVLVVLSLHFVTDLLQLPYLLAHIFTQLLAHFIDLLTCLLTYLLAYLPTDL